MPLPLLASTLNRSRGGVVLVVEAAKVVEVVLDGVVEVAEEEEEEEEKEEEKEAEEDLPSKLAALPAN